MGPATEGGLNEVKNCVFIKSNQVKNWSGYVGTYDREIVFASESLAKIINDLGLEKVPM